MCITVPSFNSFKTEKLMKELLKKELKQEKCLFHTIYKNL